MPHIRSLDWKQHSHIGLDLDETIAATMLGFLMHAHDQGELLWIKDLEGITTHDEKGFGNQITREKIFTLWEEYGLSTQNPESVAVIPGAEKTINELRRLGRGISIITARSDKEHWKRDRTYAWVERYFPYLPRESIHFVNHYSTDTRPKSTPCKDIGVTLMVEDALENTIELCENNISCILLEKPWNRHQTFDHPLLFRARDWDEVFESLSHYE